MSEAGTILNIKSNMSIKEVHDLYVTHSIQKESYIYNGHWILRPPTSEIDFTENKMPSDLKPFNIWNMVKEKIEDSDIVLGIINQKAYGTISEIGYACSKGTIAVYVLPEYNIDESELQDLWFIFQIVQSTKHLWKNEDIEMLQEFRDFNIYSIQDYEHYLASIVPNFMKRQ